MKRKRARKRTMRSAIRTEITELRMQAEEAKKFIRTRDCTMEDRAHMKGFLVGLDYGLGSLELLLAEAPKVQRRK